MALKSGMHVVLSHNAPRKKLSCPKSSSSIVLKRGTQEEHWERHNEIWKQCLVPFLCHMRSFPILVKTLRGELCLSLF